MKRFLIFAMVLAFMAPLFSGGQGETASADTEPAVLNWNLGSAGPKTIDPGLNGANDGGDICSNTFEGLVRERSGKIIPGIAESWDVSADGKTVTFKLRKSKWSDGSDLTEHDFEYAWKRAMDPATASEYSWLWHYTNVVGSEEAVEGAPLDKVGVKAVDDYTLVVTLKNPTEYFVSLTSFYHFMPVKKSSVEAAAGGDGAWARTPGLAVSNGPFVLTDYKIGEGLTLEKNKYYWNADEVGIDVINVKFIDTESTAYTAYQAGELDFLSSVPPAEVPKLIAENPEFYVFPLLGTYYYNFNMDLDIWKDARVRKAMSMAIDRKRICDVLAGGQVPAAGFIPPGMPDNQGRDFFETAGLFGLSMDDGSVDAAKKLMAEAGYPNGEGFPEFVMLYNTSESHQLIAEMMQEMWKTNLGITCTLENQEWAVFQDTTKEGDFQLARGGWLTDFLDPMGLLAIFTTGNTYNTPKYSNAEYDELLRKANASVGMAHFDALYAAQEIFMNEMPIIPVYHYTDSFLSSPKVKNWNRSMLGSIDFGSAYIVE